MAANPQLTSPASRDKSSTTTSVQDVGKEDEKQSIPTGWMRMKTFGRGAQSESKLPGVSNNSLSVTKSSATEPSSADDGLHQITSNDELLQGHEGNAREQAGRISGDGNVHRELGGLDSPMVYKVYKRRWFGLVQLVLLNIIVSWDWLTFSAVSTTASQYYGVDSTAINWLSTSFLFAFVVVSPATIMTLHRGGPRHAIIIAAVLLLLGNWIRYGGTKATNFPAVVFGQILTGIAQPFVLSAPTRYSDLWFSNKGRVAATAVMSLANPFGGALAQLVGPNLATDPSHVPDMVLYIAIIATVAALPSFFIPARPPTPCSPSSEDIKQAVIPSLKLLAGLPEFWMICIPFMFFVALFNSISTLINQILEPYGFTEDEAGIGGALLIVVGLVMSAIISPIIDRSKKFLLSIKVQVPIIAICYLAFIWCPQSGSLPAPYIVLSLLGAASFSLVPVALEYLIEITHPVSPEVTSTICWSGGQLFGGIIILISNELTDGPNGGPGGSAPFNMQRTLWLQAIIALVMVPLPLALGCFGRERKLRLHRVEADRERMEAANVGVLSV